MECATCKHEFVPVRSDQKWDSTACRNRWLRRKKLGLPTSDEDFRAYQERTRRCPVCEEPFRADREQQTHCTNACTVRGRRRLEDGQPESDREWAAWKAAQVRTDGLKTCTRCGQDQPADAEHFYTIRGKWSSWCRGCNNRATLGRKRAQRERVLAHYGGSPPKCACCGEAHVEFLCIDHENGGGNEHRRTLGVNSGGAFYAWLEKAGLPPGYRVLCHNCNSALGFYGRCPHTEMKHEAIS